LQSEVGVVVPVGTYQWTSMRQHTNYVISSSTREA
jgi:hypothetical protein